MGLDGVELVMETEKTFGISISNDEAEAIRTPGMLIELIRGKVKQTDERYCRSQRAFYLLRKALQNNFGSQRCDVNLSTSVTSYLDQRSHVPQWNELQKSIGATRWPALTYSPNVGIFVASVTTLGFLSSWIVFSPLIGPEVSLVFALGAAGFLYFVCQKLSQPIKKWVPKKYASCRNLVPFVISASLISWTAQQIHQDVKRIVIEILGIPEEKYRLDADFVKDLGMD